MDEIEIQKQREEVKRGYLGRNLMYGVAALSMIAGIVAFFAFNSVATDFENLEMYEEWSDAMISGWNSLLLMVGMGVLFAMIGKFYIEKKVKELEIEINEKTLQRQPTSLSTPMQSQPKQGKFCPYCGTNNPSEHNYCSECQKPLNESKKVKY